MRTAGYALALAVALGAVRAQAENPGDAAPPAQGQGISLDQLLARWSAMPGLSASFVEEKQLALLSAPLRSEGTIHFLHGRGVAVHVRAPSRQSTLVTDRQLVLWDGHTVRRINLDAAPSVAAFAQVFSLLLGADRAALDRTFSLVFQGQTDPGWSLRLLPRAQALRDVVSAIELEGSGTSLAVLRIREANGDTSTLRLSAVDAQRHYSDAEADQIFRVPPP